MSTHKSTIDAYNQNARADHMHVSDPNASVYHSYYEKPAIRSLLPDLHGLTVLSVGCGSGLDARYLKDSGAESVTGIDISSQLIDIARNENTDIDFHVMDMEKLSFQDEYFDLCYSSFAVHYLESWTPALREARRVLKQNGKYVFSVGHPIDSAMEQFKTGTGHGKHLGRTIQDKTGACDVHGDYLGSEGDGVTAIDGALSTMNVRLYQRTFSKMIEEITNSGFTIERALEPQPVQSLQEVDKKAYETLQKIPSVMIWSLVKER